MSAGSTLTLGPGGDEQQNCGCLQDLAHRLRLSVVRFRTSVPSRSDTTAGTRRLLMQTSAPASTSYSSLLSRLPDDTVLYPWIFKMVLLKRYVTIWPLTAVMAAPGFAVIRFSSARTRPERIRKIVDSLIRLCWRLPNHRQGDVIHRVHRVPQVSNLERHPPFPACAQLLAPQRAPSHPRLAEPYLSSAIQPLQLSPRSRWSPEEIQ